MPSDFYRRNNITGNRTKKKKKIEKWSTQGRFCQRKRWFSNAFYREGNRPIVVLNLDNPSFVYDGENDLKYQS